MEQEAKEEEEKLKRLVKNSGGDEKEIQIAPFVELDDDKLDERISQIQQRVSSQPAGSKMFERDNKFNATDRSLRFQLTSFRPEDYLNSYMNQGQQRIRQMTKHSPERAQTDNESISPRPLHLQYAYKKGRDLTMGQNHLIRHEWMMRDRLV